MPMWNWINLISKWLLQTIQYNKKRIRQRISIVSKVLLSERWFIDIIIKQDLKFNWSLEYDAKIRKHINDHNAINTNCKKKEEIKIEYL